MKEFLQKIKLLSYLTLELNVQKVDFIAFLKQKVDDGSPGILFQVFDLFSFSKNLFKGRITANEFTIRKKRKFFQSNNYPSIVNGKFQQKEDKLYLVIEINGLPTQMMVILGIMILFYASIFGPMFIGSTIHIDPIVAIMVLGFTVLMLAISYYLMRKNVREMKTLLEEELFSKLNADIDLSL